MKKLSLTILVFVLLFGIVQAQSSYQQIDYNGQGVVYDRELAIDLRLHTNGFALAANFGRIKTYYRTRYYHIEIGELKHPKEYRQSFDNFRSAGTSRSFIFGKQNNFFVLRGGIGEKRYFSEKARRKGLAIGINYEAGPSIGILKPYYLEINRPVDPSSSEFFRVSERYSEENASAFLDVTLIQGASGFSKGLSELSFIPGLHLKGSVHFDWGAFDEFVKAIEAGIMADIYIREVPILADVEFAENRPFFINLFINLQLGKRW